MNHQQVYNKLVYPAFHFRFKDLSPERSELLDRLSSNKKLEMWTQKDIKTQGLLDINELGMNIPRSVAWIKLKIKELKIEPKVTHKKKNYYSEDAIVKLKSKIK